MVTGFRVNSSQLDIVGLDPIAEVLYVAFKPKADGSQDIYSYKFVDEMLFKQLMTASSHGSFFIQNIKRQQASHPFQKLTLQLDSVFPVRHPASDYGAVPLVQLGQTASVSKPKRKSKAVFVPKFNAAWCW